MKSVVMTIEHLRSIKVREMERVDMGDNFIEQNSKDYLSSEFKRAVLDEEGQVVFVFGGKRMGNGVGWVWMLASDLLYKNPIASMEMILKLHEEAKEMHKDIKRYYTFNSPEFPQALRFLKRLGYSEVKMVDIFKDGKERIVLVKEVH
jgi:hypothetical protein